jgi:hypothetical protein
VGKQSVIEAREKSYDVERKREQRSAAKDVDVPQCENVRRRKRLEKDDAKWLLWYFAPESETADPFTYKFERHQREMIAAIAAAIANGEDKAIAAPRGEGKTTLAERLLLKYTLQGKIRFSVLFAATGGAAQDSLESIKQELETNVRLMADYPEVCAPVAALENTPNRAHYQTVSGKRHDNGKVYARQPSRFSWCGQEIVLPKVPGSPSAGSIIATRGLDSAVRGVKKKGRRPDVAIIDDPDTEDTARSEEQAKKLETRIDRAIAGLGSQKRSVSRVMLTTLQSRISASYKYTDPAQKPSWRGHRFKFLVTPPERIDLWDEYIAIQQADWVNETSHAHEFYIANRDAMDAGAVVANPNRYVTGELSAIQHYYNLVARLGQDAVDTEWQNDPPEETGPIESGITAHRVQTQVSGYDRLTIPPECKLLTMGIDCQKRGLYWVVRAWRPDATGFTIDYGFYPTFGTTYGKDIGVDSAIRRAIVMLMEDMKGREYVDLHGEIHPISLAVVDAGYETTAVYQACSDIRLGILPAMGYGKSGGCARPNFHQSRERRDDYIPGDGWNCVVVNKEEWPGLWRVDMDADRWKSWEHDRWMTFADKPGTMMLFGVGGDKPDRMSKDQQEHMTYAKHIVAEVQTEEFVRGVLVRKWTNKHSRPNHYLDASYMANVAANIKGIRLLRQPEEMKPAKSAPRQVEVEQQTESRPYLASER